MQAHGVLSPSKTPGAADLLIVMQKRKPFDAKFGVDNYGSKFLGPWQATLAASVNSFFGHNERITAQIVDAPDSVFESELFYAGIDYEQPIFDSGLTFELFVNDTNTNPGFTLEQFDVHGTSVTAGGRLKYPFIRTRALTDTGRITFDISNVDTSNNVEPTRHDRIRSIRVGNKLEFLDTIFGAGYNVLDVEDSRGLNIWDARSDDAIDVSRANADPDYNKITLEAQRLQRVTDQINLLAGFSGQYSDSILYTSEEFGIGGTNYGRGYDPSEILGDSGIAGKLELQWNDPSTYHAGAFSIKNQAFVFYDVGRVWANDATTSSGARASLASTGLGIRSTIDDVTSFGLMIGFPLTRPVATRGDNAPRVFVGLYRKI
jgi:hemolysin activation/secretion protein